MMLAAVTIPFQLQLQLIQRWKMQVTSDFDPTKDRMV